MFNHQGNKGERMKEYLPLVADLFNIEKSFIISYSFENDIEQASNGGIIHSFCGRGQTITCDTNKNHRSIYFPYGIIIHDNKILFKYN